MKKLEVNQHVHENKKAKMPLAENVLNRIREINARDDRAETDFIRVIDETLDELVEDTKNPLAKNYLRIITDHHKYDRDIREFQRDAKKTKEKVESLAELVAKRQPHATEDQQLEIVDQLFEFSTGNDDFRIHDEIAKLKILLDNETFKIKSSEPGADTSYLAMIQAQITDLAGQLSG